MSRRSVHYEAAFEHYLRARRIPYVSVDEGRKAILPDGAPLRALAGENEPPVSLKSFDFVVYGDGRNLLLDVKGRKIPRAPFRPDRPPPRPRLESWVTRADVESLAIWRRLFGAGFDAALVFVYWCDAQPPDGLFDETFEHRERWYAVRAVALDDYTQSMTVRSPRWGTLHVPSARFDRIARPFLPALGDLAGLRPGADATPRSTPHPSPRAAALHPPPSPVSSDRP